MSKDSFKTKSLKFFDDLCCPALGTDDIVVAASIPLLSRLLWRQNTPANMRST